MLYTELKENESVQRLIRDKRGSATITLKGGLSSLERKTAITSAAVSTSGNDATSSGVVQITRALPFVPDARRRLFIRDLLTVVPMDTASADFVQEETAIGDASPQTEASAKLENAVTLTTVSQSAKTISSWLPASRQILDDLPGLQAFIEGSLRYAVLKKEQDLVLVGNNTGQQLNGIANQATAFDISLLNASDGYEYTDIIFASCQQLAEAEYSQPSFIALHPRTYWTIRRQKASDGTYIHPPITASGDDFRICGLVPVITKALSQTQFIVGTTDASDIVLRERSQLKISIAVSHDDYFAKDMVAVLAEERVALVVYRPGSFVTGTFSQSPA